MALPQASNRWRAPVSLTSGAQGSETYDVTNPWSEELQSSYNNASTAVEEAGTKWNSAIDEAEALTGKDYTDELRRQAAEELDKQYKDYGNSLGAQGMRELSFRSDVQDDWSKRRTDASTQAAIDAQGMQESALNTLNSLLSASSGAELDAIASQISAASAGSSADQSYDEFATDLMKELGYYSEESYETPQAAASAKSKRLSTLSSLGI